MPIDKIVGRWKGVGESCCVAIVVEQFFCELSENKNVENEPVSSRSCQSEILRGKTATADWLGPFDGRWTGGRGKTVFAKSAWTPSSVDATKRLTMSNPVSQLCNKKGRKDDRAIRRKKDRPEPEQRVREADRWFAFVFFVAAKDSKTFTLVEFNYENFERLPRSRFRSAVTSVFRDQDDCPNNLR